MGLFAFDRQVLRHYHLIALFMAIANLGEAVGILWFTVDGLAWFNLVCATTMGLAWPIHEKVVQIRRQRAEPRQTHPAS